ncbi:AbrB/MazE/SpoVT family DNA-binding domain-containing protein [Methylobacterium flocculans]|uniref:AbrB/MazE/SpoVT family DNA-binding domain-containing protein n=1 Tax=Methylobacterium flocculans TaxID=2984843 RepID=UPI0021F327FC|nr:MazF family transcriptional regulator [Methylobacterium sp. FF17]
MEAKVVRWGEDLVVRLSPQAVTQLGLHEGETVEVLPKRQTPDAGAPRTVNGIVVPTLAEMIAEMDRLGPSQRPELVDWGPDVGAEIICDDDDR